MNCIDKIDKCYGCGACKQICPVGAIEIVKNEDGFYCAIVNKDKCINCSKCIGACPRLNPSYTNYEEPVCYAVMANDEIRLESSSGGVFTLAAEFVLQRGGCVVGAAWGNDFNVEHHMVWNEEGIKELRGSKYAQSNTLNTYSEVKNVLESGKYVLYTGCPCQIAGLRSYLGKEYEKLYTVDLICHGTPSSKVLKKYLEDAYEINDVQCVDFRDKSYFGWSTEMNVYLKDGTIKRGASREDTWYRAFLNQMSLNKVCESCQFSRLPRQGDISIGDFWNIENYDVKLNDRKGTSLVLINSEKGEELVKAFNNIYILSQVPMSFVRTTCNKTIFQPFKHHYGRDRFFREINWQKFDKAVNKCLEFKYDIGLVTTWFARNYGAVFTAYALYKKLEKWKYSVLMINKPEELWGNYDIEKNNLAADFGRKKYNYSKVYSIWGNNNIRSLNNSCDIFMLGSDQLWNPKVYAKLFYFCLDFVDERHKKIAYATSIGATHFEGTKEERKYFEYYLSKINHVSVREQEAVKICQDELHVPAVSVMDPVFLLEQEDYDEVIKEVNYDFEPYLGAYILDVNESKRKLIDYVAERLKLKVRIMGDAEHMEYAIKYLVKESDELITINMPEEWLFWIKNSSFFITDSYHGACFSIIYKKQFLCIGNEKRGIGRFLELFGKLGIQNNLLCSVNEYLNAKPPIEDVNYSIVEEALEKLIKKSEEWLLNSLNSEYEEPLNDFVVIKKELNDRLNRIEFDLGKIMQESNMVKTYSGIGQLGLKRGCSVNEIISKLPINSIFQQAQGALGEPIIDTPVPYGILHIIKTTDYFVSVTFTQMTIKNSSVRVYSAKYINGKIESWDRILTEEALGITLKH